MTNASTLCLPLLVACASPPAVDASSVTSAASQPSPRSDPTNECLSPPLELDGIEETAALGARIARTCLRQYFEFLESSVSRGDCLIPSFLGGKPVGFKVFCVRPNSLFYRLGFRPGDVVIAIQDIAMVDADSGLRAYNLVRALPPSIAVNIIRDYQPLLLQVSVLDVDSKCLAFSDR